MAKQKNRVLSVLIWVAAAIAFLMATFLLSGFLFDERPATDFDKPSSGALDQSTPRDEWAQGVMPKLYQTDSAWRNHPYANEDFGESGCGPTCLAMVYIYVTGDTQLSPTDFADRATRGDYVSSEGTSWSFMSEGAMSLGLAVRETALDEATIAESLSAGHPIICTMGPGDFTSIGHFIVIAGMDESGNLIVHDPNSKERTERTWDASTILEQYRNAWIYGVD